MPPLILAGRVPVIGSVIGGVRCLRRMERRRYSYLQNWTQAVNAACFYVYVLKGERR